MNVQLEMSGGLKSTRRQLNHHLSNALQPFDQTAQWRQQSNNFQGSSET
jgi:hypothetical protein